MNNSSSENKRMSYLGMRVWECGFRNANCKSIGSETRVKNSTFRNAFTIVELLVVIAIIGILATMLLPALSNAKGIAKVNVCIGNMKQIYLGTMNYALDYNSMLPRSTIWKDTYSTLTVHSADNCMNTGKSGAGKTAWYVMNEEGFLNEKILECPSSDRPFSKDGNYNRINYGYRYNTGAVDLLNNTYLPYENTVLDKGTSKNSLFCEAAGYRRVSDGSGKDVSAAIYNTSQDWNKMKWSHSKGGNVAAFDGHVEWVKNQIHPFASTNSAYNSWPTIQAAIKYRADQGLDLYLSN